MDCSRCTLVGLVAVLLLAACGDRPQLHIREAAWISPVADLPATLSQQPVACEAMPAGEAGEKARAGRVLFNSPALLGGKAAQMGLSCASCHPNGRHAAEFYFDGISGHPGTADVTNGYFSKVAADRTFNPKTIPDLADREATMFQDRGTSEFRVFVEQLVVAEFSGQVPTSKLMDELLAYLEAIDARHCDGSAVPQLRHPDREFGLAADALWAARRHVAQHDLAEARMHLRSSRNQLEALYERTLFGMHDALRLELEQTSRAIGELIAQIDAEQRPKIGELNHVTEELMALQARYLAASNTTAYNKKVLQRADLR